MLLGLVLFLLTLAPMAAAQRRFPDADEAFTDRAGVLRNQLRDQGVTTGALMGALAYLVQSLLPALQAMMTAVGAAGSRLVVVRCPAVAW
jgi:ATP-binding cassette subfamily C protein